MKLHTLTSFVLVLWICTCQYAIYRSRIRTGNTGQLHCRLRGGKNAPVIVRNISTLGTSEVRLLFSPGSQLHPPQNYANQMLVIYNVRCNDDERIFINITWQDIQPRDCGDPPVCADYIQVIRSGGIGVIETCGNDTGNNNANLLQEQAITVLFRTSEVDEFPGFEMYAICYKPEERDLPGCTRVEGNNVTTSENDTAFGEGTSSRNRRELQDYGLAEERIVMELMRSQFAQLTPADDVVIDDPELPTEDLRWYLHYLDDFDRTKRRTEDGKKFDAGAVRTAIINENACNPILRASTRSVLTVNTRINKLRVREIREELQMAPTQPPTMPQTTPTMGSDKTTLGADPTTLDGIPAISVECEATTTGIIEAVDQIFYPSVSGSIKKISIWIKPDSYRETVYRVRIYHSLVPGTNLIASSNRFTLGSLSPSTPAQFYDFTFPSSINFNQGDGYIWSFECLSRYCGAIAFCPDAIQGHGFQERKPGGFPRTSYNYAFKLYITI